LEIDDKSDSGDDREVIAFVLVLDQLEVRRQVHPLVDCDVVVELETPHIAQFDGFNGYPGQSG
jgi:hypothetical protein